jgi:hypothetical protein
VDAISAIIVAIASPSKSAGRLADPRVLHVGADRAPLSLTFPAPGLVITTRNG